MPAVRTVLDVVRLATNHLQASGVIGPRLDAEVLLAHVLGLDRIQLYVQHDRPLTSAELDAYRSCIARRAKREPVAYIVGEREFFSRPFLVNREVLVPRPETEHLVEAALERLQADFSSEDQVRIADIGTGSGVVAVTLALSEERATVAAVDVSEEALRVAVANAERYGVSDRIEFCVGDLYRPLEGRRFHAVVSNPPYISDSDYQTLPPEVRLFEPKGALVGGRDGLDVIRRLIEGAPAHLLPGGFLALEFGANQGEAIGEIARERDMVCRRILPDLAGRDRVALITLASK